MNFTSRCEARCGTQDFDVSTPPRRFCAGRTSFGRGASGATGGPTAATGRRAGGRTGTRSEGPRFVKNSELENIFRIDFLFHSLTFWMLSSFFPNVRSII